MIVKKDSDVQKVVLEGQGIKNVTRQVLIGTEDGSQSIVVRKFSILPGGNTPFHRHDFEHVINIVQGRGIIVKETGEEIAVSEGQSAFIEANEKHQFKNPSGQPFDFLCIILNPEKSR